MTIDTLAPTHTSTSQDAPPGDQDEDRPGLIGDGYDPEPLLTAEEVGEIVGVPTKSVYELPIKRVRLSRRRVRWRPADVREFINRRVEDPA